MAIMKTPSTFDLLSAYCKVQAKWAVVVWLHYGDTDTPETFRPVVESGLPLWPDYWDTIADVAITAILEGMVVFLSDTQEEMETVYDRVRGKDGLPGDPTPGRFYACTYAPDGTGLTENT